jgi:FkbM family methyltransferase
MIELKQIDGTVIDLSISPKFVEHYNKPSAYAKYILDNEINNGQWDDDLLLNLPDDAVIFDIGMNVGLFSLYLPAKQRKFYCVEPCEAHIEVAKELFSIFGYKAEIWKGVISNKVGPVKFFEEPQNTTSNRIGNDGNKWVQSETLKNIFKTHGLEKIDLLKIDAEGSEREIILYDPTVQEALTKCKIVFVETHTGDGTVYMTVEERDQLIDKIKSFGFTYKLGNRHDSHYFINNDLS